MFYCNNVYKTEQTNKKKDELRTKITDKLLNVG